MEESKMPLALTYDDVLVVPGYSTILPKDTSTETEVGGIKLAVPLISSPMDTVTEEDMAIRLALCGGIGIIHRNMPIERQCGMVQLVKAARIPQDFLHATRDHHGDRLAVGAAIGALDVERAKMLVEAGVDVIVVDVAHGYSGNAMDTITMIKESCDVKVWAANVVHLNGVAKACGHGADAVRVGLGGGSICSTSVVTGVGMPQLSAIMRCADGDIDVIADGGIRNSGDAVKAFVAGASAVMVGGLLAGCGEAPSPMLEQDGVPIGKMYRGMGSKSAMTQWSADRYGHKHDSGKTVAEGVEAHIPFSGSVDQVVHEFVGGLKSAMGYIGAHTIRDMALYGNFVRVTNNGRLMARPHSLGGLVDPNHLTK